MRSVRLALWLGALALAGCSLLFDGAEYEGRADAGTDAGGTVDAGPDLDAAVGPDGGQMACTRHEDCLLSPALEHYVCVPHPMTPGTFFCAARCLMPADCGPVGGGPAHDEGSLCLTSGDCGCDTSEHCEDPTFPSCDRATHVCEEPTCASNAECGAMAPGTVCFGGLCQRVMCSNAADCTGEAGVSSCVPGPAGAPNQCSDFCQAAPDCPAGSTCPGTGSARRCT